MGLTTHTRTPASPQIPKKVDFCRHFLLRNRTGIPGMVPKSVSPTGETCIRPPARVNSHGDHQDSPSHFWSFRGANTLCCIPSLFSGKPAHINNSKSGEGRSDHLLITCETTAAPKEQRDGKEGEAGSETKLLREGGNQLSKLVRTKRLSGWISSFNFL